METLNAPTGPIPIIPVTLSEEQHKKLEEYLKSEIDQALRDRGELEKSWAVWAKQYNSRLEKGGSGDADIDMASTYKMLRQEQAKVIAPLFKDPDFWVVKPANPKANADYRNYGRILKQAWQKFDSLEFATVAFRQARVFSYVPVKIGWTVERETALAWIDIVEPSVQRMMADNPDAPIAVTRSQALVEKTIEVRVGSFPRVIPIEDFLYPWYSTNERTAPWRGDRSWMTRAEVQSLVDEGHLPPDTFEKIKDPASQRPRTFALEQMNREITQGDSRHYQMCEIWLDWKVDEGKPKAIIAHFERESGKLIHTVYNWLNEYRDPYEIWTGEERDDGIPGVSLAYRLEPLHRAKSASVRQRLDAATLANQILIFADGSSDIMKHFPGGTVRSGVYPTTADVEKGIKQFKISEPSFNQMQGFEQMFDEEMKTVSGLSDPDFGQEAADRPTATGTLKVMESGGLPADLMRESFRRFLSRVAKKMLARYRQFMPDGFRLFLEEEDDDGLRSVTEFLGWPEGLIEENVLIETLVNSATINKNIRKSEAIAVVDKLPQLYGFALTLAQQAATPGPAAFVAKEMLVSYIKAVDNMLKELDVETREDLIQRILEGVDVGGLFSQVLELAQQQIQQLQAQNTQLSGKLAAVQGGAGMGPGSLAAVGGATGMEGAAQMGAPPQGLAGEGSLVPLAPGQS